MSASSDAARDIANLVAPALKAAGFRKRGRLFNRRMPGGVVHAVQLELQPSWGRGAGHGEFEFGVVLSRMPGYGDLEWVSAPQGQLREFSTNLRPDLTWPDDFKMGTVRAAEILPRVVLESGLPWLNQFPDEDAAVDRIESFAPRYHRAGNVYPKSLIELFLLRGERDRATKIVREIAAEPMFPKKYENFHPFFVEHGWDDIAASIKKYSLQEWHEHERQKREAEIAAREANDPAFKRANQRERDRIRKTIKRTDGQVAAYKRNQRFIAWLDKQIERLS